MKLPLFAVLGLFVVQMSWSSDLEDALLDDLLPRSSSMCVGSGRTNITLQFSNGTSYWDPMSANYEDQVFLAEISHSDENLNRTWKIRVAQGSNIYSFVGAFGESVPPQQHNEAPWIDEVWQTVAVNSDLNNPPDDPYFIHQAGTYMRDPVISYPFYSPNLAKHCKNSECSFASWGQQAHVPTQFKSGALYLNRYKDCGDGVMEFTSVILNTNADDTDIFSYINMPWGGVRTSTFRDILLPPDTASDAVVQDPLQAFGADDEFIPNLEDTGGYATFAQEIPGDSAFELPDPDLELVIGDAADPCAESPSHTSDWGLNTVFCAIEPTVEHTTRCDTCRLQLTNEHTGAFVVTSGVLHWAAGGASFYFWPESATADEVNAALYTPGQTTRVLVTQYFGMRRQEDNLALAMVFGTDPEGAESSNTWHTLPARLRFGTAGQVGARDYTVFTVNPRVQLTPGNRYAFRQYFIADALEGMDERARGWVGEAEHSMAIMTEIAGRDVMLWSEYGQYFGVTVGNITCVTMLPRCVGSTTPATATARPLYAITCGEDAYVGSDLYHFAPSRSEDTDPIRSYVCDDAVGTRVAWKLLGFFEEGACALLQNARYNPNFSCQTSFASGQGGVCFSNYHGPLSPRDPLCAFSVRRDANTSLTRLFEETNGDSWVRSDNWKSTTVDVCYWYGVTCVGGHVTEVRLPENNLQGVIPDDVFNTVPDLEVLDLRGNRIGGHLPSSLAALQLLNNLDLAHNRLIGALPDLAACKFLKSVDISYNRLSGTLDLHTLPASLSQLILHHNALSGSLDSPPLPLVSTPTHPIPGIAPPPLVLSRHLSLVDLSHNSFIGPVPAAFLSSPFLLSLNLASNHLSGPIPEPSNYSSPHSATSTPPPATTPSPASNVSATTVTNTTDSEPAPLQLRRLDLSGNSLTGDLPDVLSRLWNVTALSPTDARGGGAVFGGGDLMLDLSATMIDGAVIETLGGVGVVPPNMTEVGGGWGWMAGTIDLRGSRVRDCPSLQDRHGTDSRIQVLCDEADGTTTRTTTTPNPTTTPTPSEPLPCNCSGNGYCPGGDGVCVCFNRWSGSDCSAPGPPVDYCFSLGTSYAAIRHTAVFIDNPRPLPPNVTNSTRNTSTSLPTSTPTPTPELQPQTAASVKDFLSPALSTATPRGSQTLKVAVDRICISTLSGNASNASGVLDASVVSDNCSTPLALFYSTRPLSARPRVDFWPTQGIVSWDAFDSAPRHIAIPITPLPPRGRAVSFLVTLSPCLPHNSTSATPDTGSRPAQFPPPSAPWGVASPALVAHEAQGGVRAGWRAGGVHPDKSISKITLQRCAESTSVSCRGGGDGGCGDGVRGLSEECDDGGLVAGDGCSGDCRIDGGFRCEGGSMTTGDVCERTT